MTGIIQGSPEWFAARCGKVTASRISDVMATTRSGEAAARRNYRAQLVAERLTGEIADTFSSPAMRHGTDTEPQARAAYVLETMRQVTEVGFVDHPTIPYSGASPDGLVGDDGLLEIKCPNTATHIASILSGEIDRKYILQMHWQAACTKRNWCDFESFDPRMPDDMRIHIQRVDVDRSLILEIEDAVQEFLAEVEAEVDALTEKFRSAAA